jgi:hypothetical protein
MGWLDGEPTLDEMLSDPTILALMERDEVDPDELRMFLQVVKSSLRADAPCARGSARDVWAVARASFVHEESHGGNPPAATRGSPDELCRLSYE